MGDIHTEGIRAILEAYFTAEQSPPATFYVGLATDSSLAETATLASLTEVSGDGYARQEVTRDAVDFTSGAYGTNDRSITSKEVTFEASGDWTTARTVFLATSSDGSGKLIYSETLSIPRTLGDGDSLALSVQINGIG